MSEYKFGDWYCVPANEEEAKEIINRAVASGAKNEEFYTGGNPLDVYGVNAGFVSYCERAGTEYTIEELRRNLPLPGESVEPERWNGEGLPPVGTECEFKHKNESDGCYQKCYVVGETKDGVMVCHQYSSDSLFFALDCWVFRPLRTEREKFVESASNGLSGDMETLKYADEISGQIYDAIKSGALKAPEVE